MGCDGNCNQGRTCNCKHGVPLGECKLGEPDCNKPKINWDKLGFYVTAIAVVVYIVVFFNYIWKMDKNTIRYDCRLAEISVDYPAKVKEDCRKKLNGRS